MLTLDAEAVAAALPYADLVDALEAAFAGETAAPLRTQHEVPVPGERPGTLLTMPAWRAGERLGVKIVTVFPDNALRGRPAVSGTYLLMDATTGEPQAVLDGTELTLRRTAAASALASRWLSRRDAARLLMVGTGQLAPHLVAAHAAVRPITAVTVWGRDSRKADALAAALPADRYQVRAAGDLEKAVRAADIVSCATLADEPLVAGEWLAAGQHVDLVGAFTPDMREADAEALRRTKVYVDTRAGALSEAGDVLIAIAEGVIGPEDILGELSELARGEASGRETDADITLFKSVGTALEDLAAAALAADRFADGR